MLLSEFIGVNHEVFKDKGILDTFTELDANYYINVFALQSVKTKEFTNSHKKIFDFFNNIYKLLNSYNNTGNIIFFNRAVELFNFPEVNEIGIGLAQGNYGKGLTSNKIRVALMNAAKDIIKEGNKDPELFLLMGILTEGIGVDFISDMISNIILEDIKSYTKRINVELFGDEKFFYNKRKKCDCYYLPTEIVDEVPIPRFMYEIDSAVRLNMELRSFLNDEIGYNFMKASKEDKIQKIIKFLKNRENFDDFIEAFKTYEYEPYDFESDDVGIVKLIAFYKSFPNINFDFNERDSHAISLKVITEFKKIIENTGIYDPFIGKSGKVKEKNCQNLFYLFSKKQFEQWNLDLSPECNQGRGPSDFKVSLGENNKCIIEVKLLSNRQYAHGIDAQIIEYANAENCKELIYFVFDDLIDEEKSSDRLTEIKQIAEIKRKDGFNIDVIVVKVEKKLSASLF